MPEQKKYFSYMELPDGSKKHVKDAEAREDIKTLQQQVAERYQVTVTGHTCVFGNNAIVIGHKLVLT